MSAGEWISKRSMATSVAEELLIDCFTSVLGHPDFIVAKTLAEKLLAEMKSENESKALKTFASKVSGELLNLVSDKTSILGGAAF